MYCTHSAHYTCHHCHHRHYPRYGFGMFLLDLFLIAVTGGLWVFYIIYRIIRSTRY